MTRGAAVGLPFIEAFIGRTNAQGLGYYSAMGFETYRETDAAIVKRFAP
ncbi:hypothetical protein [Roseobacter sp. HKCCA0434]|nr:hypothetical protein [Roseobacter sp. HKCCA0434]